MSKGIRVGLSLKKLDDIINGIKKENDCEFICRYFGFCINCPFSSKQTGLYSCRAILGDVENKKNVPILLKTLCDARLRNTPIVKIKRNDDNGKNKR